MKNKAMRIKRCFAKALVLLVAGLLFSDCGGRLIPPADEVTTRMNAKDERALKTPTRRRTRERG
jgi:hypothetical protein